MKLSAQETQNSLLQLLFERGPVGARNIPLGRVEEIWAETTLRRGDLLEAIVHLSALGHLVITDTDTDALVSLTVPGIIAARGTRAPEGQPWGEHLHQTLLPRQRPAPSASAGQGRGRRSYEGGRSR